MSLAVANRERRKTAGRRMTSLVGKALEEDDTFWGHDTWAEDADSGNESFHESDVDSEQNKDEFDSDFNDSESDHDDEEKAAGMEEEEELKRTERSANQRTSNYVDIAQAGRELMQKKKGKGKKRVMGDGINAGIVLNFPSAPLGATAPLGLAQPSLVPGPVVPPKSQIKPKSNTSSVITLASSRRRRSHFSPRQLRETRSTAPSDANLHSKPGGSSKRMKRKRYAQEELLLEAVNETEPENERWLLARKRVQDLVEKDKEAMSLRDAASGKIIEKYHSRRGCLITLTFPEMDSVPEILTRPKVELVKSPPTFCAVTGKRARYRDPLTNMGYYDASAFKELRRRHNAGETLVAAVPEKEASTSQIEGQDRDSCNEGLAGSIGDDTSMVDANGTASDPRDLLEAVGSSGGAGETSSGNTAGTSALLSMHSEYHSDRETDQKQGPMSCGSAGNGKATQDPASDKPPDSPMGRRSRRKWKPSSKLLQNIALADKKAAAVAGALTIRLEEETAEDGTLGEIPSSAGIKNQRRDKRSTAKIAPGTPEPILSDSSKQPAADGPQTADTLAQSPTVTGATNGSTVEVTDEKPMATEGMCPTATLDAVPPSDSPHQASKLEEHSAGKSLPMNTDTDQSAGGASEKSETNEIDRADAEVSAAAPCSSAEQSEIKQEVIATEPVEIVRTEQVEPVYFVPSDEGDQQASEPRYITQSELIMEAIHAYSRRQEERERSNSLSKS